MFTLRRDVFLVVVCRVFCAKVVDVTSREDFLVFDDIPVENLRYVLFSASRSRVG